jgi:N-acyl homoserine lactone hydrolase
VLMTPGHTPGHSALMVKLAGGTLMLTGDLWLSHAEALKDDMPDFNTSRAETLASRQRFGRLAWRHDATVVIQHEIADIDLLPTFPQAAS